MRVCVELKGVGADNDHYGRVPKVACFCRAQEGHLLDACDGWRRLRERFPQDHPGLVTEISKPLLETLRRGRSITTEEPCKS